MKSYTQLKNTFLTLSQNSSAANATLAGMLINEQSNYLLLKFFDTERSFTMLTIGPQNLTLTAGVSVGDLSATLSAAWTSISCQQLVVFSSGEQRTAYFTQNSASITWQSPLTATGTTALSCVGVQAYPLPANVAKIKNSTITIGQLVYTPAPVQSIQEWTKLNALPYNSSIPAYFFVYNNQLNFWPIPSASGEIITINCQVNQVDMSYEDYNTGTIASGGMTVGSNLITTSGTSFTNYPKNTDLSFVNLYFTASPPNGDGIAYQIQSFTDDTHFTLLKPVVNAPNPSGGSILIGQYPMLYHDFHDAIVYGALRIYFSSIVKDADRYQLFNGLFNEKLQQMEFYLSTKQINVDLSVTPEMTNPNLYWMGH